MELTELQEEADEKDSAEVGTGATQDARTRKDKQQLGTATEAALGQPASRNSVSTGL